MSASVGMTLQSPVKATGSPVAYSCAACTMRRPCPNSGALPYGTCPRDRRRAAWHRAERLFGTSTALSAALAMPNWLTWPATRTSTARSVWKTDGGSHCIVGWSWMPIMPVCGVTWQPEPQPTASWSSVSARFCLRPRRLLSQLLTNALLQGSHQIDDVAPTSGSSASGSMPCPFSFASRSWPGAGSRGDPPCRQGHNDRFAVR